MIFIYDVEIDEAHRGKGYGRAAMELAEEQAVPAASGASSSMSSAATRWRGTCTSPSATWRHRSRWGRTWTRLGVLAEQPLGGGDRVELAIRHRLHRRVPVRVAPRRAARPRRTVPGAPGFARGLAPARASAHRTDATRSPSTSLSTPSPLVAVVTSTGGGLRATRPPAVDSMARSCRAARSAPGRSPLLTTITSATSSSPALMACTSSPMSGTSTTTVVSASRATSTSLCPAPTVSITIGS